MCDKETTRTLTAILVLSRFVVYAQNSGIDHRYSIKNVGAILEENALHSWLL